MEYLLHFFLLGIVKASLYRSLDLSSQCSFKPIVFNLDLHPSLIHFNSSQFFYSSDCKFILKTREAFGLAVHVKNLQLDCNEGHLWFNTTVTKGRLKESKIISDYHCQDKNKTRIFHDTENVLQINFNRK